MTEPLLPLRARIRGASDGSRLLMRMQAGRLIDDLAARGIRLRLVGETIKWSTNGVDGLTIGEMREVKRLTPSLWEILEEGDRA